MNDWKVDPLNLILDKRKENKKTDTGKSVDTKFRPILQMLTSQKAPSSTTCLIAEMRNMSATSGTINFSAVENRKLLQKKGKRQQWRLLEGSQW